MKVLETIPLLVILAMLYLAMSYTDSFVKESCLTDTECGEAYDAEEATPQFAAPSRIPVGYILGGK